MITESRLVDEYEAYCKAQGLPWWSADELILLNTLTPEQRRWISDFIVRWDECMKETNS